MKCEISIQNSNNLVPVSPVTSSTGISNLGTNTLGTNTFGTGSSSNSGGSFSLGSGGGGSQVVDPINRFPYQSGVYITTPATPFKPMTPGGVDSTTLPPKISNPYAGYVLSPYSDPSAEVVNSKPVERSPTGAVTAPTGFVALNPAAHPNVKF